MAITITPQTLDTGIVNVAYSQTVVASGGTAPYTFSISPLGQQSDMIGTLPPGLSLNSSTGVINGTPTYTGLFYFTIGVSDSSSGTATINYVIGIGTFTIGDIANWVVGDYLNRGDITTAAQNAALKVYRVICGIVAFDELTTVTPEIPFIANKASYDLSLLVPPLLGINNIRASFGASQTRRLAKSHPRLYDSLSFTQAGQPSTYARTTANQIQVNPAPNSSTYSFRIRYWTRPPENQTKSSTAILAPLEWQMLFEWEAAYQILNIIGQEQRAATLVQPMMMPRQSSPKKQKMLEIGIIPRLWNELLKTRSEREVGDDEFGINPVMRPYNIR